MHEPDIADNPADPILTPMQTDAELFIRDSGEVLVVFDLDECLGAQGAHEYIARLKAHALNLSQRAGVSVLLDATNMAEEIEVFEAGGRAHKLDGVFWEARTYRVQSWVDGASDPWGAWEVGNEPVTRYVPPKPPECGCTTCEAHTEIEF
ncbi:hypothetical protein [Microbacterium sp. NPDC089696]|uniref:hypothetical protein n=1 Tax=Microbacterium sp. NPDC089696 TaxID=3364199 RepID=UPI0037FF1573